jgi:hypothetical protein
MLRGFEIMIAARYDKFRFEQGATFDVRMTYRNKSTGSPFDLTGYTAIMSFKENPEDSSSWLELTTENGGITLGDALGTIDIYISPDDTQAITVLKSYYTLDLIYSSNKYRILKGYITLSRG